MIIHLDELNTKEKIVIDAQVLKDNDLDKRIIDLKDAYVKGEITKDSLNNYHLNCNFNGFMIISDAISLDEVPYKFAITIAENLEEIQETNEIKQNILDLKRILWQNIVLEVPISYTQVKDAKLKGNGWELIQEIRTEDTIDPRFEKLKDLLKGDD